MPALQVRDLPQDIYEELKLVAKEQKRSLTQQTALVIREGLDSYRRRQADAHGLPPANAAAGTMAEGTLAAQRPLQADSAAGDRAQHVARPFIPFTDGARTHMHAPDETCEQRIARRQRLLDGPNEGPSTGLPEGAPTPGRLIATMRSEREDALFETSKGFAW